MKDCHEETAERMSRDVDRAIQQQCTVDTMHSVAEQRLLVAELSLAAALRAPENTNEL